MGKGVRWLTAWTREPGLLGSHPTSASYEQYDLDESHNLPLPQSPHLQNVGTTNSFISSFVLMSWVQKTVDPISFSPFQSYLFRFPLHWQSFRKTSHPFCHFAYLSPDVLCFCHIVLICKCCLQIKYGLGATSTPGDWAKKRNGGTPLRIKLV